MSRPLGGEGQVHFLDWAPSLPKQHNVPFALLWLPVDEQPTTDESDLGASCLNSQLCEDEYQRPSLRPWPGVGDRVRPSVTSSSGSLGSQVASEVASLAAYLATDDTRMPPHPCLAATAADPQSYDTYVGEDDWKKSGDKAEGSGNREGDAANDEQPVVRLPRVDATVEWLYRVLETTAAIEPTSRPQDGDFGVVLGGAYGVANDAAWAVSSRTVRCSTVADVFTMLRMSSKLLQDLDTQGMMPGDETAAEGEETPAAGASKSTTAETSKNNLERFVVLKKFRALPPGSEFRAFVQVGPASFNENGESDPLLLLGACQRCIDQVHNHLAAWTLEESNEVFKHMEAFFVDGVGRRVVRAAALAAEAGGQGATQQAPLIVAVDLVYESMTTPMLTLGVSCWPLENDTLRDDGTFGTAVTNVDRYRLFRSSVDLVRHHMYHHRPSSLEAPQEQRNERPPLPVVFVATAFEELCGDVQSMQSHRGLPLEFQNPSQFPQDEEMLRQLLERMSAQHQ